jgi:predicted DNA-binding transcriptional regulator AlpA
VKSNTAKAKKLLNIKEAAFALGIHPVTLGKLMRQNAAPPSLLLGKRRYFNHQILDQWIRARSD